MLMKYLGLGKVGSKQRGSGQRKISFRQWLNLLLILASLMLVLSIPILQAYGSWLSPSTANPVADVAVALGDGARFEAAVKLLRQGNVQAIYIDSIPKQKLDELIAKHALSPTQVIWGGCLVPTTFSQAQAFQRASQQVGLHPEKIVLVSDRYHLRRSQWVFRHILGPDVKIETHATSANKFMSKPQWWKYKAARNWVSSETQKLLFYWFYYGLLRNDVTKDIPFQDYFRIEETSYDPQTQAKLCAQDQAR